MTTAVVEVNECKVFAVASAADYWITYRDQCEAVGRITILQASIGDLVHVSCDDRDHATWLAAHLVSHGGLPRTAVKARTLRGGP